MGDCPAVLLNLTERLPAVLAMSALGPEAAAAARAARSFAQMASAIPSDVLASGERGVSAAAEARAERRRRAQSKLLKASAKATAKAQKDLSLTTDGVDGEQIRCNFLPGKYQ